MFTTEIRTPAGTMSNAFNSLNIYFCVLLFSSHILVLNEFAFYYFICIIRSLDIVANNKGRYISTWSVRLSVCINIYLMNHKVLRHG